MSGAELSRNVERIGHLDIPGGGQVVVHGQHAFIGHMKPPHGTSIVDVSDPRRPRLVASIDLDGDASHTHKVRVVGDLMYTNVEQNNRHFLRKGERLPGLRKSAQEEGRTAIDAELASALGVAESDIAELDAARERGYEDGGFRVYDIADPAHPREVSRWHMPGQHVAAGEVPDWPGQNNRLHHAMRVGDEFWAAVWFAGVRVLDASDIASWTVATDSVANAAPGATPADTLEAIYLSEISDAAGSGNFVFEFVEIGVDWR